MPAYDYSAVSDIYDDFCVFGGDFEFFQDLAASAGGPVLELMAGTGRVSLPMIEAGADLTCVDLSPSMLSVLARKIETREAVAALVCADVCSLPFEKTFRMVVLPFQGFTELVRKDEQLRTLAEVARLLPAAGKFVCTSHNPAVRAQTIDDRWREFGRFPQKSGETLVLSLKTCLSERSGVVKGTQSIEIFDPRGQLVNRRVIELEFSLVSANAIIEMASTVGLQAVNLYGDYQGTPYDETTSQCVVVLFERVA
jgi:ubiquinone/menaquinone biosynthesis C-methylase UbiE